MKYLSTNFIQSQDRSNGALFKGVSLATVTDTSELSKGTVKVKFQWRKYKNENDPIEVRIITSDKNEQPSIEVHDVVLVAFEQGNFEYPFILGFIYPPIKDTES